MNLSALMTAYNRAKWHARRTGDFDESVVHSALGILMAHRLDMKRDQYHFDFKHCSCPDAQIRHRVCKHSVAAQIAEKMRRIEAASTVEERQEAVQMAMEFGNG